MPNASMQALALVSQLDRAALRLLMKFHRETDCGEGGHHWAECEALVDAFGYTSYRHWMLIRLAAERSSLTADEAQELADIETGNPSF